MRSIFCIVGTRPEAIKMAPVIGALRGSRWARTTVVSTGQHKDLTYQTLRTFNIDIDIDLEVMTPNQTLAGLNARLLDKADPLLAQQKPDLILAQGDTTTVMALSLASFYRRIPFGHVEAGLRTKDLQNPFPEELNRVITSLVADLHFAPTETAKQHLLNEGIEPGKIHVTGNTVIDALLEVSARKIDCSYPVDQSHSLILLTAHRRENFGEPMKNICSAIRELHASISDIEIVYPVHPNPMVRDVVIPLLSDLERVHLIQPVNYLDLVGLMKTSKLVLTDSGGIQEEAPALGKPVLVLRRETERPEAVEAGVAALVGTDTRAIVRETLRLLTDPGHYRRMSEGGSPYGDGHAASRIAHHCARFLKVETAKTLNCL
jgi:UDP-N-acetylglucosamine 2-epimerase (non-hydrolysing)